MNQISKVRPSAAFYGVPAAVTVAGAAIALYVLFTGIAHFGDSIKAVDVPGSVDLVCKRGSAYTVFTETAAGSSEDASALQGLTCEVTSATTGATFKPRRARSSSTYETGDRVAHSILEFSVPEDGSYRFACTQNDGLKSPPARLTIDVDFTGRLLRLLATFFGAGFGALALASITFVIVYVARERSKKRIAEGAELPG